MYMHVAHCCLISWNRVMHEMKPMRPHSMKQLRVAAGEERRMLTARECITLYTTDQVSVHICTPQTRCLYTHTFFIDQKHLPGQTNRKYVAVHRLSHNHTHPSPQHQHYKSPPPQTFPSIQYSIPSLPSTNSSALFTGALNRPLRKINVLS